MMNIMTDNMFEYYESLRNQKYTNKEMLSRLEEIKTIEQLKLLKARFNNPYTTTIESNVEYILFYFTLKSCNLDYDNITKQLSNIVEYLCIISVIDKDLLSDGMYLNVFKILMANAQYKNFCTYSTLKIIHECDDDKLRDMLLRLLSCMNILQSEINNVRYLANVRNKFMDQMKNSFHIFETHKDFSDKYRDIIRNNYFEQLKEYDKSTHNVFLMEYKLLK